MIFVDSAAWFASVITADPDHAAATAWLAGNRDKLLTTDYVLDETLTLLRARDPPTLWLSGRSLVGYQNFRSLCAEL